MLSSYSIKLIFISTFSILVSACSGTTSDTLFPSDTSITSEPTNDIALESNNDIALEPTNDIALEPTNDIALESNNDITLEADNSGVITVNWLPPTENTDNSSLENLAGYKIYYGESSGNYTKSITLDNPGIASYVIEGLEISVTYYFAITAVNTSYVESVLSNEEFKNI